MYKPLVQAFVQALVQGCAIVQAPCASLCDCANNNKGVRACASPFLWKSVQMYNPLVQAFCVLKVSANMQAPCANAISATPL